MLVQNLQPILENLIREADSNYYSSKYLVIRKAYLENKSINYLAKMLPGAKIYKNLYYSIRENGEQKRVELDGLILYDQNLLLIEAKSAPLSISAQRGGVERIKRDVNEVIVGAYSQCKRAKDYIDIEATPCFYDAKDQLLVKIGDKKFFKNIFLINVTLDSFGILATHLSSIKAIGLLDGKEWPWSVYLNDLRVISELIEFPSQFLHYLQSRIRINEFPQFENMDELDIFGFYLKENLYFKEGELDDFTSVTLTGYTDEIDNYYQSAGGISEKKKPCQQFTMGFRKIINNIELSKRPGFTIIVTKLLDFCGDSREEFAKQYERVIRDTLKDHNMHNFSMLFNTKASFGFTVVGLYGIDKDAKSKWTSYCLAKKQKNKINSWFCLLVYVKDNHSIFDFLFA
ncbi:MAG: hypothetical protein MUP17_07895 [candidate division Zixibacteria bacterium]|nr:hypothetical protein [candidate division Zixibacteria bacterium]